MKRALVTAVALLALAAPALALDATSADNLAGGIIAQLGRSRGIVSIPNCGNGQLARAFLAASGMKVHAMDSLQANVDATRQLVEPTGAIGQSCSIEKKPLGVMPYVNRFLDCIVITNLTDASLAAIPYSEVERVLAPDGLAFVGRATSEGAGITQAALQNWINSASKARSTATVSTVNGTWAVVTGVELSGIDVWPMHNYDVNGSNYSKDSVAALPWLGQAKMKPYQTRGGGTVVTSGGRVYEAATDLGLQGPYPASGIQPPPMLRAYSIYNGELLWSRTITNDGLGDLTQDPIRAYGRDVYLMRSTGGILQLNGITGAEIGTVGSVPSYPVSTAARPTNNTQSCGPYHASGYYTFNGNGMICWDFRTNKAIGSHFYKPPCGITGSLTSNGMFISPRPTCNCGQQKMKSWHIDGPAGSFVFDRDAAADGSDRIEKGAASPSASTIPDSLDWPTHRANNSRTGCSKVAISTSSTAMHRLFNWQPTANYVTAVSTLRFDDQPEKEPTPPVVVGNSTYFGGTDGYIRCISNTTGTQTWSYLTGGRVHSTPTVANGCVYAGSYDGYAYCLNASTGQLVWRFRGAPVDMRFNLYGYLSSLWPVLTGVLVDSSNNAYFAAGEQSDYGTHVYCVNATTGALKWQNNKTGTTINADPQMRLGVCPSGYMTLYKNKIIMANSVLGTASFNQANGALDPTLAQFYSWNSTFCSYCQMLTQQGYQSYVGMTRGREVGIVNNTFYMSGGPYIFRDRHFRQMTGYGQQQLNFQAFDASNMPLCPVAMLSENSTVTSAWDNQTFFGFLQGCQHLAACQISDLTARITSLMSLPTDSMNWAANSDGGNSGYYTSPATMFTNTALSFSAIVLTPNALVATYTKSDVADGSALAPETVQWYVGALNRTTGASLWEIALPDIGTGLKAEPLQQGLAIDRNGNVIVSLYNGNILCYGTGTVSVAAHGVEMPTAPQPTAPVAQATSWSAPQNVAVTQNCAPMALSSPGSPLATEQPQTQKPQSAGGALLALPAIPQTEQPSSSSQPDTLDMVTLNDGSRAHAYPPDIRAEMVAATVGHSADKTWRPERECLPVASVKATSCAHGCQAAATIDRDLTSRWTPLAAGPQSITYDLGSAYDVAAVSVVWYAAKVGHVPFAVEVSADGKRFEQVDRGTFVGRGTNTALRTFMPCNARYVRITIDAPVSVYEVGIHGPADARSAYAK